LLRPTSCQAPSISNQAFVVGTDQALAAKEALRASSAPMSYLKARQFDIKCDKKRRVEEKEIFECVQE